MCVSLLLSANGGSELTGEVADNVGVLDVFGAIHPIADGVLRGLATGDRQGTSSEHFFKVNKMGRPSRYLRLRKVLASRVELVLLEWGDPHRLGSVGS